MQKKLSRIIVKRAFDNGIIEKEDIEEYIYGISIFLSVALNVISACVIGVMMKMLVEILMFITFFKLLRSYTGGSHSKTAFKCYISSCVMYVAVLILLKYFIPLFNRSILTVITVISAVILFIISPVDAVNKQLDDKEREVFRKKARFRIITFLLIFMTLHYLNIKTYYWSNVIAISFFAVCVFAIVGKRILINSKK